VFFADFLIVAKCLLKHMWFLLCLSPIIGFGFVFLVLMGRTRKDTWKEYWSTKPVLAVPNFPQTMSRNRFEQIWTYWHFND
jgi:hypothetical protein